MHPVIEIQSLGKQYRLHTAQPYLSLRDVISNPFRQLRNDEKKKETFWALKDINLNISKGERVGIIGRNGAGKSTLLKIISRITPPTTGRIAIEGKVASLLEVGTGFHPELTGRENIYFNGAILGMTRNEINQRFDAIVAFSGVETFLDNPLKHYSSGMQLRLAFSVAAHLEPDVLLIDEVLAVGDSEFQQKCIGKMQEISRQHDRTILFTSHNMAAIRQLCTSVVVLQQGEILFQGPVNEGINLYSNSFLHQTKKAAYATFDLSRHPNKISIKEGVLSARLLVNGVPSETFIPGGTLQIDISYFLQTALIDPEIGLVIKDDHHTALIGLNNKHIGKKLSLTLHKEANATIVLPHLNIAKPGTYRVDLYFGDGHHFYECLYDAFEFTVAEEDVYQSGVLPDPQWNIIYLPGIDIRTE